MEPPNKTTTELVFEANALEFIDYKLANSDPAGGGEWPPGPQDEGF